MFSRKEIQKIAVQKLSDAELLLANECYDNAYYLGGYAVELALKARICKNLNIDDLFLPHSKYLKFFKVHDFDTLLMFSGLIDKFEKARINNLNLHQNWSYICQWREDSRYIMSGLKTESEVKQFLSAINDSSNGFLQWIKKYW